MVCSAVRLAASFKQRRFAICVRRHLAQQRRSIYKHQPGGGWWRDVDYVDLIYGDVKKVVENLQCGVVILIPGAPAA